MRTYDWGRAETRAEEGNGRDRGAAPLVSVLRWALVVAALRLSLRGAVLAAAAAGGTCETETKLDGSRGALGATLGTVTDAPLARFGKETVAA